jgi:hypothetical protein
VIKKSYEGLEMKSLKISLLVSILAISLFAQKTNKLTSSITDSIKITKQINTSCPVEAPINPTPYNGAVNIPLTNVNLNWTNGAGTTGVEVWFGSMGNITKVYDGSTINSYSLPNLSHTNLYWWFIICKNDTCETQGSNWTFTTTSYYYTSGIEIYPQSVNYWTGTCNSSSKTQVSLVEGHDQEVGWMVFNLSSINQPAYITSVEFHGYLYANNWPYWSITSMGTINPVTADAETIFNQVSNNYQEGVAYYYNEEPGTMTNGWISRDLGYNVENDLQLAKNQGWFAIGITDFDFSQSYYVEFQGWQEANKPYLVVEYSWCDLCFRPVAPSNLTSQVYYLPELQVRLSWQDNSWNEDGFRIYRKDGYFGQPGNFELVGTVYSNVTQYSDNTVSPNSIYTYRICALNAYGMNASDTTTIAVPVPVELASFTAEVSDKVVNLFWTTATETNNSGFEIHRKDSGVRSQESEWNSIGFVQGNGTTTEPQFYSYVDESLQPGNYQYRLKQTDYDGSFEYSKIVEVTIGSPQEFSLSQNYPNPFNPITKIKYTIPYVETHRDASLLVTLKVYDVLGNEVAILVNEEKPVGEYEVEFDGSELPSGIYFYQLKAGDFIQTRKMILLK